MNYPLKPSSRKILGKPSRKVLGNPGLVWVRTFTASNGARPRSAKNSALALEAKYNEVRHK